MEGLFYGRSEGLEKSAFSVSLTADLTNPAMAHHHRGWTSLFELRPHIDTTKSCTKSFIAPPISSVSTRGQNARKRRSVPDGEVGSQLFKQNRKTC